MASKKVCREGAASVWIEERLSLKISGWMFLLTLLLLVVPGESAAGSTGYKARMVTTVGSHSSISELLVKGMKMKLRVLNGRTYSTMITDYDRKTLWLIAPVGRQYVEYDLSAMGQSVPQFFHPQVKIRKKKIAEEMIGDRKATKYAAEVTSPGSSREYDGFLWVAEALPDYPLKWQDPEYQITVEWQDAVLAELDDSLFGLPEGYLKVEQPKPGSNVVRHQGEHLRKSAGVAEQD